MRSQSKPPLQQQSPLDAHLEDMPLDPASTPLSPAELCQPPPVADPPREPASPRGWQAGPFDHERLDASLVAREALVSGEAVARPLPPEQAPLAGELRRALLAAHLGVADAASHRGPDRATRFRAARGQAAQAAAALDAALALGLAQPAQVEPTRLLLARLCAMLGRLASRAPESR